MPKNSSLFALRDDIGIFVAEFANLVNLAAQGFEVTGKLGHLRLVLFVVQANQIQLIAAEAQAVYVGINRFEQFVLREPRIFQFHDALGSATHQPRIVHHARRALNVGHQRQDVEEKEYEHNGERCHEEAGYAVAAVLGGFAHYRDLLASMVWWCGRADICVSIACAISGTRARECDALRRRQTPMKWGVKGA